MITEWLERSGLGRPTVTYKLRDWLFSRQRYWGEPFPIVYDDDGPDRAARGDAAGRAARGHRLRARDLRRSRRAARAAARAPPTGSRSSSSFPGPEWAGYGEGEKVYRRETNTMPQWAGSCWYYLRYLDPTNEDAMVDPQVEKAWAEGVRGDGSPKVGPRRPLRRRRRARGAAPPVRALLAQGAVRPRSRLDDRAVPAARQPGLHPRGGVRRRARCVRRRRPRSKSATAGTSSTAKRSRASSARWARACATRSHPTTSTATTAPTRCVCTRCSWGRSTRSARGAPPTSSACTGSCSGCGATSSTRRPARRACPTTPPDDDETRRLLHRTIDAVRTDMAG